MADYKAMYYLLFQQLTDVITALQQVQAKAEEMFIETEKENFKIFMTMKI